MPFQQRHDSREAIEYGAFVLTHELLERLHHVDTAERIEPNALKQAATVMAAILYQASMREGTFPKPAPPKPAAKPTQ